MAISILATTITCTIVIMIISISNIKIHKLISMVSTSIIFYVLISILMFITIASSMRATSRHCAVVCWDDVKVVAGVHSQTEA